jgi:chromosomal replication initiation ATPase DnaA
LYRKNDVFLYLGIRFLSNCCLFLVGKEASWERVLITFEKYAIDFKKRYGSVPVLIFDNCDSLANKDPKMLEILQDTAKTAIDDSTWITVFVTSVGNAPEQMEGL